MAGKYSDQEGQTWKTWLVGGGCNYCESGKYNNEEGSTYCNTCSYGKYSVQEGDTLLTSCVECGEGKYLDTFGSTSESACKTCPSGKTSESGMLSIFQCTNCPQGKYGSDEGLCVLCPEGKYQDEFGQIACKNCPGAKDSIYAFEGHLFKGAEYCGDCARGKYGPGGVPCVNCPVGYHQDDFTQTECKECSAGKFQDQNGQHDCKLCAAGEVSEIRRKVVLQRLS